MLSETPAGTRIDVRVMPRSSRAGLDGVRDGRLIVRVTAPPVASAANDAAIAVLAQTLGVPRTLIRLSAGHTSRNKTMFVTGLRGDEIRARLGGT